MKKKIFTKNDFFFIRLFLIILNDLIILNSSIIISYYLRLEYFINYLNVVQSLYFQIFYIYFIFIF